MKLWYCYGHVQGVIEDYEAKFEMKLASEEIANPPEDDEIDLYWDDWFESQEREEWLYWEGS